MDKAYNHICEHSSTHGAVSIIHVSTAAPTLGTLEELGEGTRGPWANEEHAVIYRLDVSKLRTGGTMGWGRACVGMLLESSTRRGPPPCCLFALETYLFLHLCVCLCM